MHSPKTRVLIVEDFVPFQRFMGYILEERSELEIVGIASDGLEGAREAERLQPDLVLLDITIPKLNGMEVAKIIVKCSPQSTILFVTQQSSPGYVRETFRLGARGYVLKERVIDDLFPAVRAALEGRRFVSRGLINELFRQAR